MTQIDDLTRLRHIQESAIEAIAFIQNRQRNDLNEDRMLALALVRLIEIIGEAANNISISCKSKYSKIPWHEMVGMRNRLAHAYFDVDLDIIWQVVNQNLPTLLREVNQAIEELEK